LISLAASFALFLAIGVPIAVAIMLASSLGLVVLDFPLRGVVPRMFAGIDNFLLLAAPFYILTGEIMGRSGITERLIRLSMLVTQFFRAGTAYAVVVTSTLFSGISGTAVGDAAALGQIFIREMKREGYSTTYSAGLVAAASMLGPIIPPSVIMVIYGSIARVSIIDLFVGGLVPGLLIAGALGVTIFIQSRRQDLPRPRFELKGQSMARVVVEGLLVLSLPVVIIRGAVTGVFTTTEAGGIAVVYSIFLGMVVFRTLTLAGLWQALKVTASITASIYLILATSEVMSYAFTLAGLDAYVQAFALSFSGEPLYFLLVMVVIFTLIGTFLEPGPAVILIVPLLLPAVSALQIDPIQFAMVALLTLNIGLITPPVGVVMFVVARIARIDIWTLFRGIWPFFIAECVVILLLCLFPVLSSGLVDLIRN
jgi:tripartite ATP-independent transporter DctM subunit